MRSLSCLLLLLCVSTARAGTFPITSFEPDTTAKDAPRDTVDRPVWVGLHASPFAGGSREPGHPDAWDTGGMPLVALGAAWPATAASELWLALGYEHWSFALKHEWVSFAPGLLPYVSPLVLDLVTLRTGVDGLICRDRLVSGAIGVGGGTGYGAARIPAARQNVVPLELLAHAFVYVRAGETTRIGLGTSGGQTWLWSDGELGDPFLHWEFALRFDIAVGGSGRRTPAP
jgi:hypothetical protein